MFSSVGRLGNIFARNIFARNIVSYQGFDMFPSGNIFVKKHCFRKHFCGKHCFSSMFCHVSQCVQATKHFCEKHCFSGEASPIFGHTNANFSVFIDRIRNLFPKK